MPNAADLIECLRVIYERREGEGVKLSDENLAARLPITLSTFNRWKKGNTRQFEQIMTMLAEAGWLKDDLAQAAPDHQDPLTRLGDLVEKAISDLAVLFRHLGIEPETASGPSQAEPQQRQAFPTSTEDS